jgi:hypothetical protein
MNKKLYMISLGCSKNLVDSEVMLGLLEKDGYAVTQEPKDAGLLLVNTCGFIGSAVKEAIDEILELSRFKKDDPTKKLVVTAAWYNGMVLSLKRSFLKLISLSAQMVFILSLISCMAKKSLFHSPIPLSRLLF